MVLDDTLSARSGCCPGAEGVRAQEGKMINKSLLTLGLVINKLSEGAQLNGASAASCSPLRHVLPLLHRMVSFLHIIWTLQ
jgi:hypothetical protein